MTSSIPKKLPLPIELETQKVLKKAISANCALAKLNGVVMMGEYPRGVFWIAEGDL